MQTPISNIEQSMIPRELDKVSLPPYRVEPPDILLIEAVNNVRPPTDPLRPGDQLLIRVAGAFRAPDFGTVEELEREFYAINSIYQVNSDGTIDLGPIYGQVPVVHLTVTQATAAIIAHLKGDAIGLLDPTVSVSLPNIAGRQVISGDHIVRPDGTIALGVYGSVFVSGMTLAEVKYALEQHLSTSIQQPEIRVDVLAYNSKKYYVITDGGGLGETVIDIPYTGNETVLDAIAQIQGLSEVSSKKIWVARPAPAGSCAAQVLNVDWRAITEDAVTTTNYQLFPGDRIYIKADKLVAFDNFVAKVTSPFERISSFILLGNGVVRRLQTNQINGSSSGGGNF